MNELKPDEMAVLPTVINVLKKIHEDHPLTAGEICDLVRGHFAMKDFKGLFNGQRLRKFVNYIRTEGLLPVVSAGQNGYYVTRRPDKIQAQIDSLEGRREKMDQAIKGLKTFLPGKQTSII